MSVSPSRSKLFISEIAAGTSTAHEMRINSASAYNTGTKIYTSFPYLEFLDNSVLDSTRFAPIPVLDYSAAIITPVALGTTTSETQIVTVAPTLLFGNKPSGDSTQWMGYSICTFAAGTVTSGTYAYATGLTAVAKNGGASFTLHAHGAAVPVLDAANDDALLTLIQLSGRGATAATTWFRSPSFNPSTLTIPLCGAEYLALPYVAAIGSAKSAAVGFIVTLVE